MDAKKTLRVIRVCLVLFFLGILFGLHTVVFVEVETALFAKFLGRGTWMAQTLPVVSTWIDTLYVSITESYRAYPVMAYCMDWLSYACIVFALFIVGAIRDPVRNVWIIQVYLAGCVLASLLPWVVGPMRGVPVFWRVLDGSFGVMGFMILFVAYRLTRRLEREAKVY